MATHRIDDAGRVVVVGNESGNAILQIDDTVPVLDQHPFQDNVVGGLLTSYCRISILEMI